MSKQSRRRKIAKLRAEFFNGKPLFIMPQALSSMASALEADDLHAIDAAFSTGSREVESTTQVMNGIAVIPVTGSLRDEVDWMVRYGYSSSYQLIEREFKTAIANPQIKGVLFYFDTPGGSAIGCKRVADTIFELRGEKPVRAYVQGMCGSAGFYMASACDRIESTADSLVGSIGTIYPHVEMSKAMDEFGYTPTIFTNSESPKKGHGHPYQTLSTDAKKTLQEFVDSYGSSFVSDVARYRGTTPANVTANFGQGDAFRADVAIQRGMIDSVVANFAESLESISGVSAELPVEETEEDQTPVVTGSFFTKGFDMKISKKIRAQLFALDLIDSPDVSDEICQAAMNGHFGGGKVPSDELAILNGLRGTNAGTPEKPIVAKAETPVANLATPPAANVADAHAAEMAEARLADLEASSALYNAAVGRDAVTAEMILSSARAKHDPATATKEWAKLIAEKEKSLPSNRITPGGENADIYAAHIVEALTYRASDNREMKLSDGASALVNRPLWAVAGECLQLAGHAVDMYGSRELLAEQAMEMGDSHRRRTFFSGNEDRRYIQAGGGTPAARPGDFPNILSALANKFLDTIQLDDDYSYPMISALLPGGLNDFKPGLMINRGIVEELDELRDAEKFKELGLNEEVLSHIFLRRFGNKWGWTPIMVANDDLNAFAEGMLGLQEAWEVTQNRLVVDLLTSNGNLLDGAALFANRADVGSATNNNDRTSGGTPSDAEWAAMAVLYGGIGGVNTQRRVRGQLTTCVVPANTLAHQNATRTFETYPVIGEQKVSETTANLGLYRNKVKIVAESELNGSSALTYYGLRNPTQLNTATLVRAYFNGYGTAGRRERWYDPTDKTTWVSIEGRIAVAVKNWRYAVRNNGQ